MGLLKFEKMPQNDPFGLHAALGSAPSSLNLPLEPHRQRARPDISNLSIIKSYPGAYVDLLMLDPV